MRYHVKERAFSLNDSFIIKDERDNEVYTVTGDFLRIGDTFSFKDVSTGQEILYIKQRIFADTKQYELYVDGAEVATIERKEHPLPYGGRYEISSRDGMVFQIQGQFADWDFNIVDHYGRLLGHISKEFSIIGDKYTVDVVPGIDAPFVLAAAIILDEVYEDGDRDNK